MSSERNREFLAAAKRGKINACFGHHCYQVINSQPGQEVGTITVDRK